MIEKSLVNLLNKEPKKVINDKNNKIEIFAISF